jgi:hypothetical protein
VIEESNLAPKDQFILAYMKALKDMPKECRAIGVLGLTREGLSEQISGLEGCLFAGNRGGHFKYSASALGRAERLMGYPRDFSWGGAWMRLGKYLEGRADKPEWSMDDVEGYCEAKFWELYKRYPKDWVRTYRHHKTERFLAACPDLLEGWPE